MSMGIGTNTQNPDEGELKRDLEKIACGVWFTSKIGRASCRERV